MHPDDHSVLAYTITNAALAVDYSPRAIRKAIQDGDLPAYRHNRNGTRRIFRNDLVAWLKGDQQRLIDREPVLEDPSWREWDALLEGDE